MAYFSVFLDTGLPVFPHRFKKKTLGSLGNDLCHSNYIQLDRSLARSLLDVRSMGDVPRAFYGDRAIGFSKVLNRLWHPVRIFYVNLVLFFSWPLFRAETLSDAMAYLLTMVGLGQAGGTKQYIAFYLNIDGVLALIAGIIFAFPLYPFIKQAKEDILIKLKDKTSVLVKDISAVSNTAVLTVILVASVSSIASGSYNPFIYFRF